MLSRVLTLTLAIAALAGCSTNPAGEGKQRVVAGFYPLEFLAERIGGDAVSVTTLAQPGAEPHDLELKPSQVVQITDADLVLYLKGFQPELDEAVEQKTEGKSFDVTTASPLVGGDPHIWLDPSRMATLADAVGRRLNQPEAAKVLQTELIKLDTEFAAGLKSCQRRQIVTSHDAFGYLARRYQLEQIPITGLTPEGEPTPQQLREVKQKAQQTGATTIFFETLVSPAVAETLANEIGAKTAVLDPLEGLEAGSSEDYFSVMRINLDTLREALGCS
ncbi:MAG TPA: metal ABC transporter substrate-binding protein [Candidatus Limnocylindrales bacterium]|nr:metal ABC transporter substrate-binding protein [Candidatus Limnocylindrales bacterium]